MNQVPAVVDRLAKMQGGDVGIPIVAIAELACGARRSQRVDENLKRLAALRRAFATIPLSDAQANLKQLIDQLAPGEEIVITRDDKPLARLIPEGAPKIQPRVPGSAKGMIAYMADDFDAPLEDFKEYMQ